MIRFKLEALTEHEGELKSDNVEDIEDVQERYEECLPASNPQHPTTCVKEEEEDMMIEEYNSD